MPYKDPERKRQWEREHREQRNEARRRLREAKNFGSPRGMTASTTMKRESQTNVVGFAVGVGILFLLLLGWHDRIRTMISQT
jgi:hypothetical protein